MSDTLNFTILGCGSSLGVPRINGDWGNCDPNEPKNRRLRCSLLVERIGPKGKTTIVIDTSPDFRQQMLSSNVGKIDAVFYTHPHADHVHGIDDLRGYAITQKSRITVFADQTTMTRLYEGFDYCFTQAPGSIHPPILKPYEIEAEKPVVVTGEGGEIHLLPILQTHGLIHSLGFRFSSDGKLDDGGLCYSPDVSDFPERSLKFLQNLDCLIIDALQYKLHTSHLSLSQSLEWIDRLKSKRAILTHMHGPLDYNVVRGEVPKHVEPGFDGLKIIM